MNFSLGNNWNCSNSFNQILNKLYDLEDNYSFQFNGTFNLCLGNDLEKQLPSWLPAFSDFSPSRLIVFGEDKLGGLFCFWFVDNKYIENAPIVYIGQEMEDCDVIALNLREFYEECLLLKNFSTFNDYIFEKTNLIIKKMNNQFKKWILGRYEPLNNKNNIRTSD